jgi:hypothetical protein
MSSPPVSPPCRWAVPITVHTLPFKPARSGSSESTLSLPQMGMATANAMALAVSSFGTMPAAGMGVFWCEAIRRLYSIMSLSVGTDCAIVTSTRIAVAMNPSSKFRRISQCYCGAPTPSGRMVGNSELTPLRSAEKQPQIPSLFSQNDTAFSREMMPKSRVFRVELPNRPQPNPGHPYFRAGLTRRTIKPWRTSESTRPVNPLYQTNLVSLLPSATCTHANFADYFHPIRYPELDPCKRAPPQARIEGPARKHHSWTILRFRFLKRRSLPANRAGNRFHIANLP